MMLARIAWFIAFTCVAAVECKSRRPDYTMHAEMARWLVHVNGWGTLSTTSRDLSTANQTVAFGNIVSYSDGPNDRSTGRLLFYLTRLDATAYDLQENNAATLSIAEAQIHGACRNIDVEDPTCAKVALSGLVDEVPAVGRREAEELLFARHPDMKLWPKGHDFRIYEMQVISIRLLDFYGGAAYINPRAYYDADVSNDAEAAQILCPESSTMCILNKLLAGFAPSLWMD